MSNRDEDEIDGTVMHMFLSVVSFDVTCKISCFGLNSARQGQVGRGIIDKYIKRLI